MGLKNGLIPIWVGTILILAIGTGCSRPPENSLCHLNGNYAPSFVCCGNRLIGVGKVYSRRIDKKSLADSIALSQLWSLIKNRTEHFLKLTGLKPKKGFWIGLRNKVYKNAVKVGVWEREENYYSAFQIAQNRVTSYIYNYFKIMPGGKEDKLLDELF